jgi:hypothetical protein
MIRVVGTALALLITSCAHTAFAAPLVVVQGGVSPDQRLAVAVVPQKEGEDVDEADTTVYLIDNRTKKAIGPLAEANSGGGTWGKTTENVSVLWSPDGRFCGVNMRIGRMMHDFVIYEISRRRAHLQKLPDTKSHPKGKIYDQLTYTANSGQMITRWLSANRCTVEEYGLRPRDGETGVDGSELGLPGFNGGSLEKVFAFEKGEWILEDLRVPNASP